MAVCTSIECIEKGTTGGDLLRVVIDNTVDAYWFFDYADAMKYLNQEVIVDYRDDILNGEMRRFIKTFTIPTIVTTLSKEDNIKLYCDQIDNNASISFSDIADGESVMGCIVFCVCNQFKSSPKAVWQEFTIRDRSMHIATLRVFDYANNDADYSGQYIMTTLSRSEYGFQSEMVKPVNGTVVANPEIAIAETFIKNYFGDDAVALQYITKTNILEHLKEHVDYELGYGLMRMAMELSMVDSLKNTTKDVDLTAIGHAILCSYGHYCRHSVLSNSVSNVSLALSFPFPNKEVMVCLLDEALEEHSSEYYVLQSIRSAVDTILRVRKGIR